MADTRNRKWIVRLSAFLLGIATAQGAVVLGIDHAPDLFRRTSGSKLDIFYKVCGGTFIQAQVRDGKSPRSIVASWQPNEEEFRRIRAKYVLY